MRTSLGHTSSLGRLPSLAATRWARLALLCWAGLAFAGCDCGGPADDGCTASSDCPSDQVCVDRTCRMRADGSAADGGTSMSDALVAPTDATALDAARELVIDPLEPTIDATGTPTTLELHATIAGVRLPNVTWFVDDVIVGTIADTGVFTANGMVAGDARITARFGDLEASTRVHVRVRISRPLDGLAGTDIDMLRAGGSADPTLRWLYPYDRTVFPRGLAAPVLQLAGTASDAARVTIDIEARNFHYEQFFAGGARLQITLPSDVWEAATESAASGDEVVVGVTKIAAGAVAGPVTERLLIAQGRLTGSIYYNSYDSRLAAGGAILRVRFGSEAQVVQGGCAVCHSVSANGNRIATGLSWSDGATITGTGNPMQSGTIDLDAMGATTARHTDPDGRRYSFGALTPNGEWLLSNAVAPDNRIRGLSGTTPSRLWDTTNGVEVPAPSFSDMVQYAVTPSFAPDASALAFTWFVDGGSNNGRQLAVMSFDGSMSPPLFGAPRRVVTTSDTSRIVGWPSFLPDGRALIYQDATAFDTSTGAGNGNQNNPVYSDLRLVDLSSCDAAGENCMTASLDALNGWAAGTFTLPYGEAEEAHCNYEATVLPVAVGGYYWVVFTSRRAYGNTISPDGSVPGGNDRWGYTRAEGGEVPSVRKKLWIAAIDLSGAPGSDRSHPAFYLSGQELLSGNMRGFAALDPCRAEGTSCESAAECCGGFCRQTDTGLDGTPVLTCVPPPGGCSQELEACASTADCCGATSGVQCINGHCAQPPLT